MPHIAQLDSHVADLIAAGEVVERPTSSFTTLAGRSTTSPAAIRSATWDSSC